MSFRFSELKIREIKEKTSAPECYSRSVHEIRHSSLSAPRTALHKKRFWQRLFGTFWGVFFLTLMTGLLLWGGIAGYQTFMEIGPEGIMAWFRPSTHSSTPSFHLNDQSVYHIKKRQRILGVEVTRIISRQQPEEFLVLGDLAPKVTDSIFGRKIDPFWANQMANHLMGLRSTSTETPTTGNASLGTGSSVKIDIQNVKTLSQSELSWKKQKLPVWTIQIQFQLSTERYPRFYEASIVRYPLKNKGKQNRKQELIIVGYAAKDTFQLKLIPQLMENMVI